MENSTKHQESKSIQAILIDSTVPPKTSLSPTKKNTEPTKSIEVPAISVNPSSDLAFEPVVFGNKEKDESKPEEQKAKENKMKFVMKQASVAEQPRQQNETSTDQTINDIEQRKVLADMIGKRQQPREKPNEQTKHQQEKPVMAQQRATRRSKRLSQQKESLDRFENQSSFSKQPDNSTSESGQSIGALPIQATRCSEVASRGQEITQMVPSCARPKIKRTEQPEYTQVETRQRSETTGSRPSDLDPIIRYLFQNQKLPNLPNTNIAQQKSRSQSSLENSPSEISSIHRTDLNRANYSSQVETNLLTKEMAQELRDEGKSQKDSQLVNHKGCTLVGRFVP